MPINQVPLLQQVPHQIQGTSLYLTQRLMMVFNPVEPGDSSKTWMGASSNIFQVSSERILSFRLLLLACLAIYMFLV
jgi:hypothetical protein